MKTLIYKFPGDDYDANEDEAWQEPGRDILAAVQATVQPDDQGEILGAVDKG